MPGTFRKFQAAAFAAAVAVTLAFGSTQALAGAPPRAEAGACSVRNCDGLCRSHGFDYGYCDEFGTCWCCYHGDPNCAAVPVG